MSSSVVYHSVIPENSKDFQEFDQVDFVCSFPGRMMVLNQVRITGELEVKQGTDLLTAEVVQLDKLVGAHSLFQSIQTFAAGTSIDNVQEYPRMVKLLSNATETPNDMHQASSVCELKAPSDDLARQILRNEQIPAQHTTAVQRVPDFSVLPLIGLNQVYSNNRMLPYTKSGDVRISLTLNRNAGVFHGRSVSDNTTYTIKNMRCEFMSYEDDGRDDPILHTVRQTIKQSFSSSNAQLNFNFPMTGSRVYGSFLEQGLEGSLVENTLALSKPPNVEEIAFYWNNSTNQYVSFPIRSQAEIIDYGLDAIGSQGHNSASLKNIADNNGYLTGINLGETLDMMMTKLSVVIDSDASNLEPFLLYMTCEGFSQL